MTDHYVGRCCGSNCGGRCTFRLGATRALEEAARQDFSGFADLTSLSIDVLVALMRKVGTRRVNQMFATKVSPNMLHASLKAQAFVENWPRGCSDSLLLSSSSVGGPESRGDGSGC